MRIEILSYGALFRLISQHPRFSPNFRVIGLSLFAWSLAAKHLHILVIENGFLLSQTEYVA